MRMRLVVCVALGALVAGCSSSRRAVKGAAKGLHRQAAFDLNCPVKQIQVTPVGGRGSGQYAAQGCGRRASYVEGDRGLQLAGPVEGAQPAFVPPPAQQSYSPPPQSYSPPPGDGLSPPPPPPQP